MKAHNLDAQDFPRCVGEPSSRARCHEAFRAYAHHPRVSHLASWAALAKFCSDRPANGDPLARREVLEFGSASV